MTNNNYDNNVHPETEEKWISPVLRIAKIQQFKDLRNLLKNSKERRNTAISSTNGNIRLERKTIKTRKQK